MPKTVIAYLYVEDNDDIREALTPLLWADHRDVVVAADAEAALKLLAMRPFDVLITDVSLPGLSGTDLAREWLKADPLRPVLLFSGYEFGRELAAIGVNVRALLKTCDPEELGEVLRTIEESLPG
ncbi:MAG: hypothetical protein JWQ88_2621 [Rhodoferax sp.]|nr:hypothetical protein [Rhodoferax sp.]